jgi:hypothetical protein
MAAYYRVQDEMPPRYDVARETSYARAAVEELHISQTVRATPGAGRTATI